MKRIGSVVGIALVGAVLAGCGGSSDAAEPVVQVRATESASPVVTAQPSQSATVGEAVSLDTGDVTAVVVAGKTVGTYSVQFQALPSLDGSWTAQVSQFHGLAADGSRHAVASSQWPANPTVTASQSIFGGTLTFDTAIVELVYTYEDGSAVGWLVA